LKNYRGRVQKSATIFSNDPRNPRLRIALKGKVRPFIEIQPPRVSFGGLPDKLDEQIIELTGVSEPFHVLGVESNLGEKIAFALRTVEDGKHYELTVRNRLQEEGRYRGYIKCKTDHPKKSEIIIRVSGNIEGEISVRPQILSVGKLFPQQPPRLGKVIVMNNRGKAFQIKKLTYDDKFIDVTQKPLSPSKKPGYSLNITPKLDHLPKGSHEKTLLSFETEIGKTHEVQIHVIHRK
jgi:hypothetical protein